MTTSVWQKIALIFLGLFLSLALLEAGLRLGGFILTSMQAYENLRSVKQRGAYRILYLGEFTTTEQYPHLLEQVLNQRHIGVRFSVIDKGIAGTNTPAILSRVESYLTEYHPDMVVAMMGYNDKHITDYRDISEVETWFFRHCRVYRSGRILYRRLLKKLQGKDLYSADREVWERKHEPDDKRTAIEKADLPSEVSVDGAAKSGSKNDKESLGTRGAFQQVDNIFEPPGFPETTEHYVRIGQLYRAQDKFSQAEDSFKKAIELNPKNDPAFVELGQLYLRQGKLSRAEAAFEKAIEINPENKNAHLKLGRLYRNRGEFQQAEDSFKKVIEQAEDPYGKTLEPDPGNDDALLDLGWLYQNQGKFFQAEDIFKKAIEINPENGRVLAAMALLCGEIGKPELARAYAEKANRLGLNDTAAVTVNSYRKLKKILGRKGIKLVCVQYPMRNVEPLKRIFEKNERAIFVDNESVFKEALKKSGYQYKEYFIDMFGGDFGHCTPKGNMLLAKNIADVILKEVFNK